MNTAVPLVTLAVAGMLSGCGSSESPLAEEFPSAPQPTLLVNEDADGRFLAAVGGPIGVNEQGCVTIGDELLIAPEGSRMGDDGTTLELTGYDPIAIGDDAEVGGGHEELSLEQLTERERACASENADQVGVVAVAPGS